jgi:hypothetical protein
VDLKSTDRAQAEEVTETRLHVALSHGRVGVVEARLGAHESALKALREGRDIITSLKAPEPRMDVGECLLRPGVRVSVLLSAKASVVLSYADRRLPRRVA